MGGPPNISVCVHTCVHSHLGAEVTGLLAKVLSLVCNKRIAVAVRLNYSARYALPISQFCRLLSNFRAGLILATMEALQRAEHLKYLPTAAKHSCFFFQQTTSRAHHGTQHASASRDAGWRVRT